MSNKEFKTVTVRYSETVKRYKAIQTRMSAKRDIEKGETGESLRNEVFNKSNNNNNKALQWRALTIHLVRQEKKIYDLEDKSFDIT